MRFILSAAKIAGAATLSGKAFTTARREKRSISRLLRRRSRLKGERGNPSTSTGSKKKLAAGEKKKGCRYVKGNHPKGGGKKEELRAKFSSRRGKKKNGHPLNQRKVRRSTSAQGKREKKEKRRKKAPRLHCSAERTYSHNDYPGEGHFHPSEEKKKKRSKSFATDLLHTRKEENPRP